MTTHEAVRSIVRAEPHFRWRSQEISRIEGFSDAVFAFAVTLLVVSLEVPKTFNELWASMQGFGAFAISFAMLFQVWRAQHRFFRRYGLEDGTTLGLSAVLLFFVLFYVYPLKFLFNLLILSFSHLPLTVTLPNGHTESIIEEGQIGTLMVVYGLGFAAVSLVLTLLYLHAYRQRRALDLNLSEIIATRAEIYANGCLVIIPLCSAAVAYWGGTRASGFAGWMYMSIGPALTIVGTVMGKRARLAASDE